MKKKIIIFLICILLVFMCFVLVGCEFEEYDNGIDRVYHASIPERFFVVEEYPEYSWYIVADKETSAEYIIITSLSYCGYKLMSITPLYNSEGNIVIYDNN